ncbi:hypothetical protein NIE88_18960 [Sporolactobacillus shoreicorticis]|uniref:Uncharacterized protein n=1 Tax=Sporolactobacillus shoreicorticis TaxID=1923877 RepID=A0ABW5S6J0_9BACL|nr:hypothetical protein [Sporolactobacillus shoreicorticis]MCO7127831.1 hypothetical protein [Sporolactobacillus shoreicorticis]
MLSMLMEIRQELSELKGEIKGFNSSLAKIEAADERSQKALAIAIETQHKQQEFESEYEEHQKTQKARAEKSVADRKTTRRWLIGVLLTVISMIITNLIKWFR